MSRIIVGIMLLLIPVQTFGFKISFAPTEQQFNIYPGGHKKFQLEIINMGTEDEQVKIHTSDIYIKRDGEFGFPGTGSLKEWSCTEWLRFKLAGDKVVIKGGEKKFIQVYISVPKGITPGGRYSAILCEVLPREDKEKGGVRAAYQMLCFLKITVGKSGLEKNLSISELKVSKKGDENIFTIIAENKGNIHLIPKGEFRIRTKGGRVIESFPLTARTYTMLPTNLRDFTGVLKKVLPDGNYIAECVIWYDPKKSSVGKYPIIIKNGVVKLQSGSEVGEDVYLEVYPSPGLIKLEFPRGRIATKMIKIINEEEFPVHAELKLVDTIIDTDGNIRYVELGTTSYSLGSILNLSLSSLDIAGKNGGYIKCMYNIPGDGQGGKYGTILIKASSKSKEKKDIQIDIPVGVFILKTLIPDLKISNLGIQTHKGAIKISYLLENMGNVHLLPEGNIVITDMADKEIDRIILPPEELPIFPGKNRQKEISYYYTDNLKRDKKYNVVVEIKYGEGKSNTAKTSFKF